MLLTQPELRVGPVIDDRQAAVWLAACVVAVLAGGADDLRQRGALREICVGVQNGGLGLSNSIDLDSGELAFFAANPFLADLNFRCSWRVRR